jgi:hypothetical protein
MKILKIVPVMFEPLQQRLSERLEKREQRGL